MKRYISYLVALALIIASATFVSAQCVQSTDGSGVESFTLLAGQTIDSGQVSAQVNGDNLDVTYSTTNGWTLNEVHLWVGSSIADMPQTRKGKPIPGQFPHAAEGLNGATSYTISIPLTDLAFSCPSDDKSYLAAAHAALSKTLEDGTIQSETGWSDGAKFSEKGNWATYSTVTLSCDCDSGPGPDDGTCETAFAYSPDATCFLDIDEDGDGAGDFDRWGWTIGPLSPGTDETYDVYAGAAQCNTTEKGTYVGTVSVYYDGSTATVSFALDPDSPQYTLKETHVYAGNEILAKKNGFYTVAPGQYTEVHDDESEEGPPDSSYADSFTFNGLSGDIYVVSHATVCGFAD